ncbi:N-acetyl-gamma-glutamyl-phosphate reductase [Actinomarinicola tropica]|uniref:N-acetyl-gamma-glutamyl-phosphate reductase n=1 Tax=Actinomarinicola tropica TaxID=2789776 RepID=A0A5Q2RI30_9ACTN|nr:N-acetyl-gamma-glutamyl-phosphate reductase [Actinomarinicola tropica]QGG95204.1 N-acetyl-gamma-glutamyl-phosphate reductase [Actinomarinicola tropica]
MTRIGIIGASGFTGAELLRLLAAHPELEVAFATGDTQAGTPIAALYPSLAAAYGDVRFAAWDPSLLDGVDLVFLGLPHGASQGIVPSLVDAGVRIVDLAADFRLTDPDAYPRWYGEAHTAPELLGQFAYGLPELFRDQIVGADKVAVPGCYPTATTLALAPFTRAGLVETSGIVVDAASGVSGAGRPPKPNTTFCTVDEDFTAYGLLDHRHTAEMDQVLGATVLFTPHLAPMNRGILATCYARPTGSLTTDDALDVLRSHYADEPFVVVTDAAPSTKATLGSNTAHLTARVDERTGWLVVLSAIDNLVKGASGQAVQCANIITGRDEALGLPIVALYP